MRKYLIQAELMDLYQIEVILDVHTYSHDLVPNQYWLVELWGFDKHFVLRIGTFVEQYQIKVVA
jgi:hypothetical protein